MSESEAPVTDTPLRAMSAHNNLHALLFNATSAEYFALATQIYQLARHVIADRLAMGTFLNPAVAMDLDETVLDNSPYQAWLLAAGKNFHESTSWREWCEAGVAQAVPGAIEFIRYARVRGVEVVFITSRQQVTREATARNLMELGVLDREAYELNRGSEGDVAKKRLFMKGMQPVTVAVPGGARQYELGNKFLQRAFCEQVIGLEIILSIGDNLADWGEYYGTTCDSDGLPVGAHPSPRSRLQAALQDSQLFGRDFILLPNASYGGWLRAFEARGVGASDELAYTERAVREALQEPQAEFRYDEGKTSTAVSPKLSDANLRIWKPKGA